jgi:hypothetical protein
MAAALEAVLLVGIYEEDELMHVSGDDGIDELAKSRPLLEIVAPVMRSAVGGSVVRKQGERVGARGVVFAADQDLFGHTNSGQYKYYVRHNARATYVFHTGNLIVGAHIIISFHRESGGGVRRKPNHDRGLQDRGENHMVFGVLHDLRVRYVQPLRAQKSGAEGSDVGGCFVGGAFSFLLVPVSNVVEVKNVSLPGDERGRQ